MTHFFPSGITEGLLEHTWGSGEPAEELPLKRDVLPGRVSGLHGEGYDCMGHLGLLNPTGSWPGQRAREKFNATEKTELGGVVEGWVCPCREQSGTDLGLGVSHILCFWSLGLGESFWPEPCRRVCPVGSGITVPPQGKEILQ